MPISISPISDDLPVARAPPTVPSSTASAAVGRSVSASDIAPKRQYNLISSSMLCRIAAAAIIAAQRKGNARATIGAERCHSVAKLEVAEHVENDPGSGVGNAPYLVGVGPYPVRQSRRGPSRPAALRYSISRSPEVGKFHLRVLPLQPGFVDMGEKRANLERARTFRSASKTLRCTVAAPTGLWPRQGGRWRSRSGPFALRQMRAAWRRRRSAAEQASMLLQRRVRRPMGACKTR